MANKFVSMRYDLAYPRVVRLPLRRSPWRFPTQHAEEQDDHCTRF
jgi:hypothetical protein